MNLCRTFLLIAALGLGGSTALAGTAAIVPLPRHLEMRPGTFTLCPPQTIPGAPSLASTPILTDPSTRETGEYLAFTLFKATGCRFDVRTSAAGDAVPGAIVLTTNGAPASLGPEGYELTVTTNSVLVCGPGTAGVFYGVQSFLQLLPPAIFSPRPATNITWEMACVYIQDAPRFAWRGWMLDVVRHFFNKDEIKLMLDAMALNKLNRFHWHLDDDAGWRIQILQYPLLTGTGAWRSNIMFGLNPRSSLAWAEDGRYGGFYTQDEIREIVAYAQQRHITIVPEIEMPGHSTAAISCYPQFACGCSGCNNGPYSRDITNSNSGGVFCAAKPETQVFLQNILAEVMGLFPGPYIHIGGDEVNFSNWSAHADDVGMRQSLGISTWQAYQAWFTQDKANWIRNQGRTMIGWSEIMNGGLVTNAVLMDWKTGTSSRALQAVTNRQYVVMTPNTSCYLDHVQNAGLTWSNEPPSIGGVDEPLNVVYAYEPIPAALPAAYTNYILGAQGNTWCEYIPSILNVQFKVYPRLCAIAELTWTPAALKNYTDFTNRLVTHQRRLDYLGVNYNRSAVPPQIGNWNSNLVSTNYSTLDWDLTSFVQGGGNLSVTFCWKTGANGLDIAWAALLENGVEIDRDTHAGWTGYTPSRPLYVFLLPARKTGAVYTLRASVASRGGTNSNGIVYLPNWN